MIGLPAIPANVFREAVRAFWDTRLRQEEAQRLRGMVDQGQRSAVTGGRQLDGFARTIVDLLLQVGVEPDNVTLNRRATLPGYFRAAKQWDILVLSGGKLQAAIELKSISSSFGNNMNNRAEEALGNAVDFWTAYRESVFVATSAPWLGYLFVLADVEASRVPVNVASPHFASMSEFHRASYAKRAELLCRRLVLERHYSSACLILTAPRRSEMPVNYVEPADDLAVNSFLTDLLRHVAPL